MVTARRHDCFPLFDPPPDASRTRPSRRLLSRRRPSRRLLALPLLLACVSGLFVPACSRPTDEQRGQSRTGRRADSSLRQESRRTPEERLQRARQYFIQRRLADAEGELRAALEQQPDNTDANRVMALLLNTQGRRWEATPHLIALVRAGSFSIGDLVLLATPQEPYEDEPAVRDALQAVPDDPRPALGLVSVLRRANKDEEVLILLRKIVADYPRQIEAQAQLGMLLLDLKRETEFLAWQSQLPPEADAHPNVWLARGLWAARHDQPQAAARCCWEAARRGPNHRLAHFHLGMALEKLKQPDAAQPFLERANTLAELEQVAHPIYLAGPDVAAMQRAATLLERLGRLWETWAWHSAVLNLEPGNATSLAARDSLAKVLARDQPPQLTAGANPADQVDLDNLALPAFRGSETTSAPSTPHAMSSVQFVDMAEEIGVHFTYFDSWTPAGRELMLLETIGGGVAVLDYDADGWPDIYLTQCCRWPVDPQQFEHVDRLYRNLGNGRFRDVTVESGIRENGYSQGVAVGDVDNDGFPDLYVANVGQNRLYHNNGDGTFSVLPHHADTRLIWTTSALIADVNGDTFPDIYDVNYVTGDDVYTRRCVIDGYPRSCAPTLFDGERDWLYLNMGDGRWRDASEESGVHAQAGRGLGVVAADFNRTGRLALYVANDVMANFLLVNQADTAGAVPQFTDQGILAGVAFDRAGREQASMGIAADDVNNDGELDLLVANYYNDSNTLYLQQSGFFSDETYGFGLREPSFPFLTFGCQFLDGDLDGFPDLVTANGHVDDLRFRDEPWHMRPQYYRNEGGKRFVEIPPDRAGPFFQKECLGRGLARIDWNRDGREDFVVSNIAQPASVATNQTPGTGHWVAINLRGVHVARDAIGSQVTIEFDGRSRTRHLVGGDGFQASNQRQLIFGLGNSTRIERLTVVWLGGHTQQFADVPIDRELMIIQGNPQIHQLPRER
ncbi:MAG: tetratricopeptide repeat protein [Planctomycetes bacterium]|nr:tetratricopeptide repeat protein [Planctomycetota bacterium]